jgi:hypothetical protein
MARRASAAVSLRPKVWWSDRSSKFPLVFDSIWLSAADLEFGISCLLFATIAARKNLTVLSNW